MGTIRQTHTYAELPLSKVAYDEITAKLGAAESLKTRLFDGAIDMCGLAVTCETDADELAKNTMLEVLKAVADNASNPYAQLQARIQVIIAKALEQWRTK